MTKSHNNLSKVPRHLIKPLFIKHCEYLQTKPAETSSSFRKTPETVGSIVTAKEYKHRQDKGTVKYVRLNAFGID